MKIVPWVTIPIGVWVLATLLFAAFGMEGGGSARYATLVTQIAPWTALATAAFTLVMLGANRVDK